ncbi:hypothetical protein BJ944DRAFT_247156 [Cunninghamella echinulata]|nr:hypothetical protein BJ944DRAFT_247156 [Cunninghamella echinulata]
MHHVVLTLIVIFLTIYQVALAQVLANGNYRIYHGNYQVPSTHRYFTAEPDARQGRVRLHPKNDASQFQVWQLKNYKNDQVTLESVGASGKYLTPGRSGALPGAYVGVSHKPQRFNISKKAGGPFTSYQLAYPKSVHNNTLVVSYDSNGEEPHYVNFKNLDVEGSLQAWKFVRV